MSSSPTILSTRIPLVEVFASVPDPRARRGVRHAVAVVLTLAVAAVLAGAKSFLAVGEWVAEADREALSRLGIDPSVVLPSESTIRRGPGPRSGVRNVAGAVPRWGSSSVSPQDTVKSSLHLDSTVITAGCRAGLTGGGCWCAWISLSLRRPSTRHPD